MSAALAPDVRAPEIAARVERALAAESVVAREVTIAGAAVSIRAAASIADAITAPFAHLVTSESSTPELRVFAARLDAPMPSLPDSGIVAGDGGVVLHLHREAAIAFDRRAGSIHALLRDEGGVASWHRAKPLQVPLSIFFADRGVDFLHAGLVSLRGHGVLLAGAGGSGKSTLSIAAMLAGLDYLGDDCVAARGTTGFSVFGSGCLERAHLREFALPEIAPAEGEKDVLPIARWFRERMAAHTTIRAIVLPRVTHGAVTLRETAARDALLALAPGSILKRAVPAAASMARMAQLVRDVPSYRLEMGPVPEAGRRVRALLEELECR